MNLTTTLSRTLCFALLCCSLLVTSCEKNGPTVSQTFSLPAFAKVSTQCSMDANIKYGASQNVELTGGENLLDKVDLYVDNNTLIIKMKPGIYPRNNIVANITIPTLEFVEVLGDGDVWIDNFTLNNDLELKNIGSGNIKTAVLDLTNHRLRTEILGSGDVEIEGQSNIEDVVITGSGDYYGFNFLSAYGDIRIVGAGNADVNVSTDLYIDITGSGNVRYLGNPALHLDLSGSGSVEDAN